MRQLVRAVSLEKHWIDRLDMISPLSVRRGEAINDIAKKEEHQCMQVLYKAIHTFIFILNDVEKRGRFLTKEKGAELLHEYIRFMDVSNLEVGAIGHVENTSGISLAQALRSKENSYKRLGKKYESTGIVKGGFLSHLKKTKGYISRPY